MMRAYLDTAGERLGIDCALSWVADLINEGADGEIRSGEVRGESVGIRVEAESRPFDIRGWELLTRGAWRRDGEVVVADVCTAGFDLHVICTPEGAEFRYRWRPPPRSRAAAWALRSRFHLLARAVLIQYPALWWAGTRGRVPLHASAYTAGGSSVLLTAAGGIGRSTFILEELRSGGKTTGDNLAVADNTTIWGLVEPSRVERGSGRRMPHGRFEAKISERVDALAPHSLLVLQRGFADEPALVACSPETAARALVANTYMAGELRRYWALAATLSAGTGFGPAHPPIAEVARAFAERLPCFSLLLGSTPGADLSQLLQVPEAAA